MKKHIISKWMLYFLCLCMLYLVGNRTAYLVETLAENRLERAENAGKKAIVVIDPGHGGVDPGKVGVGDIYEKDINLEIAKKLKCFLEQNDIYVYMTRESDIGLYDENASNKKVQDLKRRVAMIDELAPQLTVSIHQNSFPDASVSGSQTFYFTTSDEGKRLAEIVQDTLSEMVGAKKRIAKGNTEYYLLKKSSGPVVIVECGFLTNAEDLKKLCDSVYQEQLAWKIYMGIERYLEQR